MSGPKTQHIYLSQEQSWLIRIERRQRMEFSRSLAEFRGACSSTSELLKEIKRLTEVYGFRSAVDETEIRNKINSITHEISQMHLSSDLRIDKISASQSAVNSARKKAVELKNRLLREKARIESLNRQKQVLLTELRTEISAIKKNVSEILGHNMQSLQETEKKVRDFGIDSPEAFRGLHETIDKNAVLFDNLSRKADTPTDNETELSELLNLLRKLRAGAESFDSACEDVRKELVSSYLNGLSENISELLQKISDRKKEEQARKQAEEKAEEERKAQIRKQNEEKLLKLKDTADQAFNELLSEEFITDKLREKTEELSEKWQNVLREYESDPDYLRQFHAISVEPGIKKLREEIKEHDRLITGYNDRLRTYEILCQELGISPKSFAMTEDALLHMDAAIMELTDAVHARDREIYVRNSIDEVMTEMGHSVIGRARELQTGITHNAIYRFEDNTAIGVTVDDCGDVCMELGGLDITDREPDEKEALELEEDMKRFCSTYAVIREKLKQRGIEIASGHELPPSSEYSQIINLSDYDVDERTIEEIMTGTRRMTPTAENRHLTIDK